MKYLFLFFLLVSGSLSAQTKCDCFDRLNNLSNHYAIVNNWSSAIETLKDALVYSDSEASGYYYYELGDYYNSLKEFDSSKLYFTKAIKFGYPVAYIKPGFPKIYDALNPDLIKQYKLELLNKIDFDIYDQFIQVLYLDQALRDGTLFPASYIFNSAPEKKAFIDSMFQRLDSLNYKLVNNILDSFGNPSAYQLGFFPSGFATFLLHLTATNNSKSDALIKKLDMLNKVCRFPEKSVLLFLEERQRFYKENKTLTGVLGGRDRYKNVVSLSVADSIRFVYNQIRIEEEVSNGDSTMQATSRELHHRGYRPSLYPANYFCNRKYHFK